MFRYGVEIVVCLEPRNYINQIKDIAMDSSQHYAIADSKPTIPRSVYVARTNWMLEGLKREVAAIERCNCRPQ